MNEAATKITFLIYKEYPHNIILYIQHTQNNING